MNTTPPTPFEQLTALTKLFPSEEIGFDKGYTLGATRALDVLRQCLSSPEGIRGLAIDIGRPLIRTSFPGPDTHKLTADEYALELGKITIGIELGLIESVEIDSHLPKVRFDAPFDQEE